MALVTGLDRARLLAWLEQRSQTGGTVTRAIYEGLLARIRRGEFDLEATR